MVDKGDLAVYSRGGELLGAAEVRMYQPSEGEFPYSSFEVLRQLSLDEVAAIKGRYSVEIEELEGWSGFCSLVRVDDGTADGRWYVARFEEPVKLLPTGEVLINLWFLCTFSDSDEDYWRFEKKVTAYLQPYNQLRLDYVLCFLCEKSGATMPQCSASEERVKQIARRIWREVNYREAPIERADTSGFATCSGNGGCRVP